MKNQFILFFISMILLISCGKTYKLTEEDYKWMPYRGNETLVFKSNTGDKDTIFLFKKDTMVGYFHPQTSSDCYEVVSVFGKHIDPDLVNGQPHYLEREFFSIKKTKDEYTEMKILLSAKNAVFYRLSSIEIDSLMKANTIMIKSQFHQYDDVYIINGEDYQGNLYERSNYITKVYWSKSNGLIRYDKKDGVHWELAEK